MSNGVVQVIINNSSDESFTGTWVFNRTLGGTFAGPSGDTLPSTGTVAGEWFLLTTGGANGLYWRNLANDAWIPFFQGTGDVTGPASATDNTVVVFDSTTGKLVKGTVVTINGTGDMAALKTVAFGTPAAVTAESLAAVVDFSVAQKVHLDCNDQASCAVTLNTPNGVGNFVLRITQGSSTATTTFTWLTEGSEDVKAPSGALTIDTGLGAVTLVGIYFDGTDFHLVSSGPMESIM